MRTWTLLLAATLAACDAGTAEQEALLADELAPPLPTPMTLQLTNPLTPGWPVTVGVTGAAPNANLKLVRSNGAIGAGGCPAPLAGGCLGITPGASGYQLIDLRSDGQGRVNFTTTLPAAIPTGMNLVFQVVDPVAKTGSNTLARAVSAPQCTDDNLEQNDDPASATVNPANGTAAHACENDNDVYRYTVADGEMITITTAFSHATDGDLDMELLDAAGAQLDSSTGTTDTEEVTWTNSTGAPAQVFARVYEYMIGGATPADNGPPAGISYTISAASQVVQVCRPDGMEPDSDALSANQITPGQQTNLSVCDGDDWDWFVFQAQAGQVIDIMLQAPYADADVDMYLLDAPTQNVDVAANAAESSTGVADTEQITVTAPATGQYFLAVYFYREGGAQPANGGMYQFNLSVQ